MPVSDQAPASSEARTEDVGLQRADGLPVRVEATMPRSDPGGSGCPERREFSYHKSDRVILLGACVIA